jgi:hypothetical protein
VNEQQEVPLKLTLAESALLWSELRSGADRCEGRNEPKRAESLRLLAGKVLDAYKESHKE